MMQGMNAGMPESRKARRRETREWRNNIPASLPRHPSEQAGMVSLWGERGMPGKKVTVTWGGVGNVTVTLFPDHERESPSPAINSQQGKV